MKALSYYASNWYPHANKLYYEIYTINVFEGYGAPTSVSSRVGQHCNNKNLYINLWLYEWGIISTVVHLHHQKCAICHQRRNIFCYFAT